jgi:alkyldihydroxyacetonephosphate synthase
VSRRCPSKKNSTPFSSPTWDQAQDAVRAMVQAKVPLSMLRLANPVETLTTLTMAGHKSLIGALETYLGWRGCKDQKCF